MVKRMRWPITFNAGASRFNTVDQETVDEILASAETVLRTTQGDRVSNPEFGVPETLFELDGADPQPFIDAIERWEPRVSLIVEVSDLEGMISRVRTEISA